MARPLTECPSNLKEAIDWILRVTGKDGQSGGNIPALAKAIKQVLSDAIGDAQNLPGGDRTNGDEFKKLWEGLLMNLEDKIDAYTVSSNGFIGNLAEGLSKFIGYKATIVDSYHGGLITGAGIAPSNMATHRLCDATIAFTIAVLEGCKKGNIRGFNDQQKNKADEVINMLQKQYGSGPEGLQGVATDIARLCQPSGFRDWGGVDSFIKQIGTAFDTHLKTISPDNATIVAQKVGEYLNSVLNGSGRWTDTSGVDGKLQQLVTGNNNAYDASTLVSIIGSVNTAIKNTSNIPFLTPILTAGKAAFISHLRNMNYMPTQYNAANSITWTSNTDQVQACAKIFLGCLPLIFSKLSYFYWRCHDSGGGWNTSHLTRGDLGSFLFGMDYHPRFLNGNKTGNTIISNAMTTKHFKDFNEGMTKAQGTARTTAEKEKKMKNGIYPNAHPAPQPQTNPTYPEFLTGCNEKLNEKTRLGSASNFNDYPLSALHLLASSYFRYQQSKREATSSRPPSTIREMLYFLAALPYSPSYDSLDSHISNYFKKLSNQSDDKDDAELMIAVADSSTTAKLNTLSAADLKYHLISTCSFSTAVLGMIQGPGASKGEPWLYEMYCNSAFNLTYGSGAALFNVLAKYSYAVQFQMTFLYWQCYNNGMRCGWQYCWFGSEIEPKKNDKAVQSHLCHADCDNHSSDQCKEHKTLGSTQCGKASSHSPLQAFLTDCLSGFCRKLPGLASNHLTTCLGPCHVPMGFRSEHLRGASKIGWNVMAALIPFCSSENSPLTQLSEKLGCLTKRTPRTLGDLFGFTWHLNGQLFKSGVSAEESVKEFLNSIGLSSSTSDVDLQANPSSFLSAIQNKVAALGSSTKSGIDKALSLIPGLPFWYNIFMVKPDDSLPVRLFKLKSTDHNSKSPSQYKGDHNDLYSFYNQNCLNQKPCGQYLRPLCYSNGATYAPTNASAYMSWILHLTDDLEYQFRELLDDFTNIDCSKVGCNQRKCSTNHGLGTHGRTSNCSCDSVVKCGGTLPLLYSKGFNFYNAFVLMGGQNKSGVNYDGPTKRSCEQFHNTLTALLKPKAPLDKLITTIDDFLYAIRWEFFSKLLGFWTIYICLILYTFVFLLDTLRVQSHLHLPSSNSIPPLALLTSGTPLPITKLTYIGQ
ncbi:variant erythrocyte surface antigen-1 family protein [Babesia caballi]|uniref:Variant erythrocyte surface antigen-1 family protein n=1 Tax=Babesia caballi TaxID=5871 RepID=A0AAV4LQ89_BABCB|nr:variant erythrocyte surface antigen-1 family protein [Babesia caballi]